MIYSKCCKLNYCKFGYYHFVWNFELTESCEVKRIKRLKRKHKNMLNLIKNNRTAVEL